MPQGLNLGAYASSSEDEAPELPPVKAKPQPAAINANATATSQQGGPSKDEKQTAPSLPPPGPAPANSNAEVLADRPLEPSNPQSNGTGDHDAASEQSYRSAMQSLTLPTIANFDIPSSPTETSAHDATKKFKRFLQLKKEGTHFNAKLESSSALRNPSLTQAMQRFGDIGPGEEYETTLPAEVKVPAVLPVVLHEDLQQMIRSKPAGRAPKANVEFIPSRKK